MGQWGVLQSYYFILDETSTEHTRVGYDFLDLLGEIAGMFDLIALFFGTFVAFFAEYSFVWRAL